jgi:hypothetical protein
VGAGAQGARAADPQPDFAFFREKIEPVLQAVCAQCHAGAGKGSFAIVARAPGVRISEADSRKNFEAVKRLIVPGKPEQSKFLLKPLAERDGGSPHEGGDRILKGTPAYRAWVDFIHGLRAGGGAAAAPDAPDFGYFVARIAPVLQTVCAQCHAGQGKGSFALVQHPPGAPFPVADHRTNYQTVLRLIVPGKPEQSRFLLKPLAEADGGAKHGGGDRIRKGDANWTAWTEFIQGVQGPPPPEDAPPPPVAPSTGEKPLVLEAEAMEASGGAAGEDAAGASGRVVAPGPGGGRLSATFRASRTANHEVTLRVRGALQGVRLRLDDGESVTVDVPSDGFAEVSPSLPLDGSNPLDGRRGRLEVRGRGEEAVLAMDGRDGLARWLSPADLPHTRLRAIVGLPDDDELGRDDAWLLFDCLDPENGKFFGFADAARKVVMGVIEGGRPRVVALAPAPETPAAQAVELGVDLLDGVAVGRVQGKPVLFVNFDRGLGAARFGFLTHGVAAVRSLAASRGDREVHRTRFGAGGVFRLARGEHRLQIDLLPQGAAVDTVTVKEVPE